MKKLCTILFVSTLAFLLLVSALPANAQESSELYAMVGEEFHINESEFYMNEEPPTDRVQWRFDFGDGTATGWQDFPDTFHTYEEPGDYTIVMSVMDTMDVEHNFMLSIHIDDQGPHEDEGYDPENSGYGEGPGYDGGEENFGNDSEYSNGDVGREEISYTDEELKQFYEDGEYPIEYLQEYYDEGNHTEEEMDEYYDDLVQSLQESGHTLNDLEEFQQFQEMMDFLIDGIMRAVLFAMITVPSLGSVKLFMEFLDD